MQYRGPARPTGLTLSNRRVAHLCVCPPLLYFPQIVPPYISSSVFTWGKQAQASSDGSLRENCDVLTPNMRGNSKVFFNPYVCFCDSDT